MVYNVDTEFCYIWVNKRNTPPETPTVTGPTTGFTEIQYTFIMQAIDADEDSLQYVVDWGDGNTTTTRFHPSGTVLGINHTWVFPGTYAVKVTVFDDEPTSASRIHSITIENK